mmetsp:Transcript_547/g.1390  ORF Transcript_547/g.1390 Transcript_547/m.1390 type:complete len:117 (+) Transcript_547:124-474(+)|eukprot:CAMPEP_0171496766 /NCGR_PEP_ID=MMETSP0958-20121227/6888_1 /TAXON_ID=87120 /ORGANISM="Aurantiochytrium limacinum, Strain ATCCMYA-1381" /LENGTH=116 /DNA_ID=CAMNT_0012030913 /DNA_START=90 /DNA_END=440 /DNA_ORIENTATION=+
MPFIRVTTNVSVDSDQKKALGKALVAKASEGLGKPQELFMCDVVYSESLLFAATDDPTAMVEIQVIGGELTQTMSPFFDTLCEHLKLETNRIFINYCTYEATQWGFMGKTVAEIFS